MRNALSITFMAAAMTLALGSVANAVTITTPPATAGCISYTGGSTTAGPGGVSHNGDKVNLAPLTSCI